MHDQIMRDLSPVSALDRGKFLALVGSLTRVNSLASYRVKNLSLGGPGPG